MTGQTCQRGSSVTSASANQVGSNVSMLISLLVNRQTVRASFMALKLEKLYSTACNSLGWNLTAPQWFAVESYIQRRADLDVTVQSLPPGNTKKVSEILKTTRLHAPDEVLATTADSWMKYSGIHHLAFFSTNLLLRCCRMVRCGLPSSSVLPCHTSEHHHYGAILYCRRGTGLERCQVP